LDCFLQGAGERLRFLPADAVDMGASSISGSEPPSMSGCGSAFAVHACAKNGDDREHVFGKLGGQRRVCFHCDCCTVVLEYSLEENVCEAAQSASVGKAHVSYTAFKDPLKKRQEAFAPAMEIRRAISGHDGGGMAQLESLALEVFDLLLGPDPCVDGVDAFFILLLLGFAGLAFAFDARSACVRVICPKRIHQLLHGMGVKQPITSAVCFTSGILALSLSGPSEERPSLDADDSLSLCRFEKKRKRSDCIVPVAHTPHDRYTSSISFYRKNTFQIHSNSFLFFFQSYGRVL